jgi:hypothetical protein
MVFNNIRNHINSNHDNYLFKIVFLEYYLSEIDICYNVSLLVLRSMCTNISYSIIWRCEK